jgi:hypothetical protein
MNLQFLLCYVYTCYTKDTLRTIIQPTELHINGLAPSRITSEVILHLSKNSKKVTFFNFFSHPSN